MPPRQMWLFALSLAMLAAAGGCKSSPKTVSTTPTPQAPKPAAPAATPIQITVSANTPDLATAVPAKTFEVKPPASFSSDKFPDGSVVEFRVAGTAGQVLHVKFNEEWAWDILVHPPEAGSHELIPGGDNKGNRLYTLPETGTYRVVALHQATPDKTSGNSPSIQFAQLNMDDPLVDPGIRPEQISLDFGKLAPQGRWSLIPYSHFEGELDDFWPSHLAVRDAHFEFRIMPIAGYKKVVSKEDMENLEAGLRANGKGADARKFPYSSYGDAGMDLATKPKFLQGDGWRGLRWIGEYAQDYACTVDLTYVFEGISDDGKFFAMMHRGVSNPEVTRHIAQECAERGRTRDFDSFFKAEMPLIFDKEISAADTATFQPSLDQLDGLVLSLKLKK